MWLFSAIVAWFYFTAKCGFSAADAAAMSASPAPAADSDNDACEMQKRWKGIPFFIPDHKIPLYYEGGDMSRQGHISSFGQSAHRVHSKYGMEYVLPVDDGIISDRIRGWGQWEMNYFMILSDIIKIYTSDVEYQFSPSGGFPIVFLDVGANIGSYTIPMALFIGTSGYVYAIEAQQKLVKYIGASAILNSLDNIFINNVIVSNASKISRLYELKSRGNKINYGAYSIDLLKSKTSISSDRDKADFDENDWRTFAVRETSLDDLFFKEDAFSCPAMVKFDIEFNELISIIGAREMLQVCKPIMFIEALCKLQLKSLFTLLDKIGYSMAYIVSNGLTYLTHFMEYIPNTNVIELAYGEPNLIAIPKEKAEKFFQERKGTLFPVSRNNIKSGDLAIDHLNIEVCVNIYNVLGSNGNNFWVVNELGSAYPDIEKMTVCNILRHGDECEKQLENSKSVNYLDPFFINYWETIEEIDLDI